MKLAVLLLAPLVGSVVASFAFLETKLVGQRVDGRELGSAGTHSLNLLAPITGPVEAATACGRPFPMTWRLAKALNYRLTTAVAGGVMFSFLCPADGEELQ